MRGFVLVTAILCAPALAFADAGDVDDEPGCQDLCSVVETCETACVPDDCLTYCERNLSQSQIHCIDTTDGCADFTKCLCWNGGDGRKHDDSGCGVTSAARGLVLPGAMVGIGLIAFALGRRARRR